MKFLKEKINHLLDFIFGKSYLGFYKIIPEYELKTFIELLKPYDLGYKLIRVGEQNDGGYLLPDVLEKVKYCFSPGVGNFSQFERDLAKRNIKSFLADFKVDKPKDIGLCDFEKKFIRSFQSDNSLEINNWIESKLNTEVQHDLMLQVDVEGAEYELINAISNKNLARFNILIFEFHNLHLIGNRYFFEIVKSSIEKIKLKFEVCHIHPNNNGFLKNIGNLKFARDIEITFLNKKFVKDKKKISYLPHPLDKKNNINSKNINLPIYWYN